MGAILDNVWLIYKVEIFNFSTSEEKISHRSLIYTIYIKDLAKGSIYSE